VGGAVALLFALVFNLTFLVRDAVSTYAPIPARSMGLGWFAAQPRAPEVVQQGEGWTCELSWRQNGPRSARYDLWCEASRPVALTELKIVSMPAMGGDPDEHYIEDQRPMAGEVITLEAGQVWTYRGDVGLTPMGWFTGARERVLFTAQVDGGEELLRLEAAEPLL